MNPVLPQLHKFNPGQALAAAASDHTGRRGVRIIPPPDSVFQKDRLDSRRTAHPENARLPTDRDWL
ncbi:MAG: hypothetical protein WCC11_01745 [Gammaproteobacteria bacterium]